MYHRVGASSQPPPDIPPDECAHRNLEHRGSDIFRCVDCGSVLGVDEVEQLIEDIWGISRSNEHVSG